MGLPVPDLVVMAWKSLSSQWIRSSLTAFGVFMGVAAVSATLNIQTITQTQIDQKLAERDKPFLAPRIYMWRRRFSGVSDEDILALKRTFPNRIRSISTQSDVYLGKIRFEDKEVENLYTDGVSLNYLETTGRALLRGRFFNQTDLEQYRPVVVVDQQLAESLFGDRNPVNRVIYADGSRLIVIGVVATKSNFDYEFEGTAWVSENYGRLISRWQYRSIQISPYRLDDLLPLKAEIEEFFNQRYPQADYIYVWDNAEDLVKEQETQRIASRALTGVGVIALVIGGVGIANITVATVMERTKEIGIRRAIGASRLEIMSQFILEAVLLSLVGGAIAVVTVHGLTRIVTTTIVDAPYAFSQRNTALAMGSAVAVGVFSSFFPAFRATQVDIVQALRGN